MQNLNFYKKAFNTSSVEIVKNKPAYNIQTLTKMILEVHLSPELNRLLCFYKAI